MLFFIKLQELQRRRIFCNSLRKPSARYSVGWQEEDSQVETSQKKEKLKKEIPIKLR
jgi:hypothetical protein